jgi:hypothetical protein
MLGHISRVCVRCKVQYSVDGLIMSCILSHSRRRSFISASTLRILENLLELAKLLTVNGLISILQSGVLAPVRDKFRRWITRLCLSFMGSSLYWCDWEGGDTRFLPRVLGAGDFTNTCNPYGHHGEDHNSEDIFAVSSPSPIDLLCLKNLRWPIKQKPLKPERYSLTMSSLRAYFPKKLLTLQLNDLTICSFLGLTGSGKSQARSPLESVSSINFLTEFGRSSTLLRARKRAPPTV